MNNNILIRITALWAFSEAFLGGLLHSFKMPFAGLVLSLVAAVCMCLMVVCGTARGGIIKATLSVIAIKFILSPHTPPMAYLAVLIQGLAGELFFLQRRFIKPAAFALTVFCLLYSALQKLVTTTLIFGKQFWVAMQEFVNGLAKTFGWQQQQYVWWLVAGYIGCYAIAGILGGVWNIKIIQHIKSGQIPPHTQMLLNRLQEHHNQFVAAEPQKNKQGWKKLLLPGLLAILLIASYTPMFESSLLKHRVAAIILRGTLIILVWNYFLSPLLMRAISNWVIQYKNKQQTLLQQLLLLMPEIKQIVWLSWQQAPGRLKTKKLANFINNTALMIVHAK
jgi:hypothetical protein